VVDDAAGVRERLLDSAEQLFAERGYHGAGIRDITSAAGSRVAAVSDLFGGKEGLFRAVLLRRATPLNEDRRRLLEEAADQAGVVDLPRLVRAFTEPMLRRAAEEEGWTHYARFVAQLAGSNLPVRRLVAEEYDGIAALFVRHLHALFPDADPTAVLEAYLLMVAATLQVFARDRRFELLAGDQSLERRHDALVRFVESGVRGLLG
jgi:AcrR family transcriptional regulator